MLQFPIFKTLQPVMIFAYSSAQQAIAELDHPERFSVAGPNEAKTTNKGSLLSLDMSRGCIVLVRGQNTYHANDATMLIHDTGLNVDPSWEPSLEAWFLALPDYHHRMIVIQNKRHQKITTELISYFVYRGVKSYGAIVVNQREPDRDLLSVIYRHTADEIVIVSGMTVFHYPGFNHP